MEKKVQTVDEYISIFPEELQARLQQVRATIKGVLPQAQECISYAIPAYKIGKAAVVYFAGYKTHIGVYPIPKGDDEFQAEIAPFKKGKGTLQFPLEKPTPLDLIAKVARVAETETLQRLKRNRV